MPRKHRILTLEQVEARHIARTLWRLDGNRVHTARVLGISRRGLYYKLRKYGLLGIISQYPNRGTFK